MILRGGDLGCGWTSTRSNEGSCDSSSLDLSPMCTLGKLINIHICSANEISQTKICQKSKNSNNRCRLPLNSRFPCHDEGGGNIGHRAVCQPGEGQRSAGEQSLWSRWTAVLVSRLLIRTVSHRERTHLWAVLYKVWLCCHVMLVLYLFNYLNNVCMHIRKLIMVLL